MSEKHENEQHNPAETPLGRYLGLDQDPDRLDRHNEFVAYHAHRMVVGITTEHIEDAAERRACADLVSGTPKPGADQAFEAIMEMMGILVPPTELVEDLLAAVDRSYDKDRQTENPNPPKSLGVSGPRAKDGRPFLAIRPGLEEPQRLKTTAHELAHLILRHSYERRAVPKWLREYEAEMTAYIVCTGMGLDTYVASRTYLQGYVGGAAFDEGETPESVGKAILDAIPPIAVAASILLEAVAIEHAKATSKEEAA